MVGLFSQIEIAEVPQQRRDRLGASADKRSVDPGKIKDIPILRTVVGGATVYRA